MSLVRGRGLLVAYLVGWLLCWAAHAGFTYWADQHPHDAVPWLLRWLETSFENLASEYHQVGVFVLLSKYLVYEGSPQSRDGDDALHESLEELHRKVNRLEARRSP